MNVSKYQGAVSAYGATSSRVSAGGSSQTGWSYSNQDNQQNNSEDSPAVINKVDQNVYSAIDEFLCLSGDDRLESYSNLPDSGKKKFMKVMGKLVDSGEVDQSKLDLGDKTEAKQSFLSDYANYSDTTSSQYSSDGRIAS